MLEVGQRFEKLTKEIVDECNKGGKYYVFAIKNEENNEYVYEIRENVITLNDKVRTLRERREIECFSIINRGKLWYDNLSEEQLSELDKWYREWLNVTDTLVVPEKPIWLK